MHVALEIIEAIGIIIYFWVEAIVCFFVPARYRSKDVKGQRVLITGGGSGLGRLMAAQFSILGAQVILVDVNEKGNQDTLDMLRKMGGQGHVSYVCDLSSRDQIYAMAKKVKSDVGDVDILINNAGIVTGRKFLDCPDSLMEKTMDVNCNAHFWTTKAFLPSMLAKNSGHIVTIASAAGLIGTNGLCDYCASKFAAVGFDESLRYELQSLNKTGIHTTVICPFFISTGMFEGAKSKFPFILPILKPETVVDKIIDAVLTNQHIVYLPRVLYHLIFLKGLLPTKCQFVLLELFGANESMDDFRGRNKMN